MVPETFLPDTNLAFFLTHRGKSSPWLRNWGNQCFAGSRNLIKSSHRTPFQFFSSFTAPDYFTRSILESPNFFWPPLLSEAWKEPRLRSELPKFWISALSPNVSAQSVSKPDTCSRKTELGASASPIFSNTERGAHCSSSLFSKLLIRKAEKSHTPPLGKAAVPTGRVASARL